LLRVPRQHSSANSNFIDGAFGSTAASLPWSVGEWTAVTITRAGQAASHSSCWPVDDRVDDAVEQGDA
jgi:hypothetical protein